MKNYREIGEEVIRRRATLFSKRKEQLKNAVSLACVMLVVVFIGFGSFFIGTFATSEFNQTTTETETEPPRKYSQILMFEESLYTYKEIPDDFFCVDTENIAGQPRVPRVLPVYVSSEKYGLKDELSWEASQKEMYKYIKMLYGEENFDEANISGNWYFVDDPYVALDMYGKKHICDFGFRDFSIDLDITAVEEYRDMTYREARDYVMSTPYYKTAVEYLGFEDLTIAGAERNIKRYDECYSYYFTFAEKVNAENRYKVRSLGKSITAIMSFFIGDSGKPEISLHFNIIRAADYDEHMTLDVYKLAKLKTVEEAAKEVNIQGEDRVNKTDMKVILTYLQCTFGEVNENKYYVPCYIFSFKVASTDNQYRYHDGYVVFATEGLPSKYMEIKDYGNGVLG